MSEKAPMADYVLSIEAEMGYSVCTEGRCTPEQYGAAMAVLHGKATAAESELRQTLQDLDRRLRECAKEGLGAHEAYDSFYQEMVSYAIAKAQGATT